MSLSERCCECTFWIKYALFVINFVVWVGGISLVVIGIWARLQKSELGTVGDLTTDPALLLLAIGAVMFSISLFGCVGSVRENVILLRIFCIVIVVVFFLEILGGTLAMVFIDKVKVHMTDYMKNAIRTYQENPDLQNVVDYVQKTFECCGALSYNDWENNRYFNCSSPSHFRCSVPPSCCRHSTDIHCSLRVRKAGEIYATHSIYTKGCINSLFNLFKENLIIIGLLALGVCFIELFAIVLANLLIKTIMISQRAQQETSLLCQTDQQASYHSIPE